MRNTKSESSPKYKGLFREYLCQICFDLLETWYASSSISEKNLYQVSDVPNAFPMRSARDNEKNSVKAVKQKNHGITPQRAVRKTPKLVVQLINMWKRPPQSFMRLR